MKNLFFVIISFFVTTISLGQNVKQIDSLALAMCKSLSASNIVDYSKKIEAVFQMHLSSYFEKMQVASQVEADSINDRVYFRLQKNCTIFRELLDKIEENKSDWKTLNEEPVSKILAKDYNSFLKGGNFFYKEYNGDIVNVLITENSWTETFQDGSTSKLLFVPKSNGRFDLQFIESNNETRKNFSVKGDLYNYGIYERDNEELLVWVITEDNQYLSFKLYKKQ